MAALMRLQATKTLAEREKDKIDELMNRPALPSATLTTFGGLKRERLLQSAPKMVDLGIVKRTKTETITTDASPTSRNKLPKVTLTETSTTNQSQLNAIQLLAESTSNKSIDVNNGARSLVSTDYISSNSEGDSDTN